MILGPMAYRVWVPRPAIRESPAPPDTGSRAHARHAAQGPPLAWATPRWRRRPLQLQAIREE
ncbi:hypothetical protein GmRootA79_07600 [Acidovorax sp. A79]